MSEFDAADLAGRAVGKQADDDLVDQDASPGEQAAEQATENHAAAEGTESSTSIGSTDSLREMLLSTDPAPSLENVESPWDPEVGGMTRMYRGIQKMTGVDGMPAFADLVIGAAEFAKGVRETLPDDEAGEQADSSNSSNQPDDEPSIGGVDSV